MSPTTRTRRAPGRALRIAAAALLTALAAGTVLAGPAGPPLARSVLGGTWTLVEQSYGDGSANLVREDEPPVRLSFARSGGTLVGTLRAGGARGPAVAWPDLTADGSRGIEIETRELGAAEERVFARYRVAPSPGDDLWLVVTEDYRLTDDGRALVGTVHVQFERGGEPRGSYTLHRRFERMP